MIKKISSETIKPGMYLHDLNVDWMNHPFVRSRFLIEDDETIAKIIATGVREVYIDTSRGLDMPHAPTVEEINAELDAELIRMAEEPSPIIKVSFAEEIGRAKKNPFTSDECG